MKRTGQSSGGHWAVERLSFRSPEPCRRRVRKRRIPLPRQTRGRDLDAFISFRVAEPASPEAVFFPTEPETRKSKLLRLLQRMLWVGAIILGLIVFGDFLMRFFREAPLAWPSINGRF